MANDFCAIRLNPEQDADIIIMLEKAPSKTDFIKACIRVARDHMIECCDNGYGECHRHLSDDEEYIRLSMEVIE